MHLRQDKIKSPATCTSSPRRRVEALLRRLFVSLPPELVGSRPALVSLTYPGDGLCPVEVPVAPARL